MTDDNKTSQEAVAEERCPLPPDLQNDLRAIGRLQGKIDTLKVMHDKGF